RKICVRTYLNKARPHLKFTVSYREAGKRRRRFFETREPANTFAAFKNSERLKYGVESIDRLSEYGKTLSDAVNFYVAYLEASEKSCSAVQLVDELITAKEKDGHSQRHVDDLRRLNIFADQFDGQPVATITSA